MSDAAPCFSLLRISRGAEPSSRHGLSVYPAEKESRARCFRQAINLKFTAKTCGLPHLPQISDERVISEAPVLESTHADALAAAYSRAHCAVQAWLPSLPLLMRQSAIDGGKANGHWPFLDAN